MDPNELKRVLEELRHERNQRWAKPALFAGKWILLIAFCPIVALIVSSELSGCSDNVHRTAIHPLAIVPVILTAGLFLFMAVKNPPHASN